MKNKPWRIRTWGKVGENGKKDTITYLSLDNREEEADNLEQTTPLLTMKVSARWNADELKVYLIQIRDALNAAGIVEGTIEDPEQPK